jgi:hypothetical protein
MPTAIDEFPRTDYHFFRMGLQYYIAGRMGALYSLTPVTGNLLHHAVEMVLKGKLAHHHSLADLKDRKKFGHDIVKCWAGLKAIFPTTSSGSGRTSPSGSLQGPRWAAVRPGSSSPATSYPSPTWTRS